MFKRTRLYDCQKEAGAVFTEFYQWQLPLHYGSQIEEHHAVRQDAGVFDVSHMTIVDCLGAGTREFLRYLLANDVDKMENSARALYSLMLNHRGGILDDLIAYFRAADNYRLVLNCGTRERDIQWIQQHIGNFSLGIQQRIDCAMLAVQGPNAREKTLSCLPPKVMDAASTLENFAVCECDDWFIARTGYTGEDGFEIILPGEQAESFWQSLIEAGVKPCGLGARDSLRLEAGMMLYGQDMDENTTPYESNLKWSVSLDPNRDFIGKTALELQDQPKRKMIGLVLPKKAGIMRPGQSVQLPEGEGQITSGGFSPSCDCSIALARVPITAAEKAEVMIRQKTVSARIVKPRFVKNGQSLIGD